jgi:signal transduction histidine kinase
MVDDLVGIVRNMVLHSQASMLRAIVQQKRSRILLAIRDDERGFDAQRERGMRLLCMQEGISHLNGPVFVESLAANGPIVCIILRLTKLAKDQLEVAT